MQTGEKTEVGLILVHGIGEQGRFEHLDGHIRGIIAGLRRTGAQVTVEIMSGEASAFQAVQDSWRGGPHAALRLIVRQSQGQSLTIINVHEVWWADVNERYSVMKQLRFWFWGLSVWNYARRPRSHLPTSGSMFPPRVEKPRLKAFGVRLRLFGVGCFFLVSSLSIGVGTVLLKRLLNLEPIDLIKTFANYLSSVKLYNQPRRGGTGFSGADFLDTIGEPPRVSIRRRMLRTIADVAMQSYDRWHILAHSQGSVVAFNGLMEPAFGWVGYLDEKRWDQLVATGMAGLARITGPNMAAGIPARPLWAPKHGIVYRTKIFARFHGVLTYGNPLEKFAAIWPASVPVCREPAFRPGTLWLNVYDPIDAVSGVMRSWPTDDPIFCPPPHNIGYAASSVLLRGHTKYLDCPEQSTSENDTRLADGAAVWLLRDDATMITKSPGDRFFAADDSRSCCRSMAAWAQWVVAFLAVTCFTAELAHDVLHWIAPAAPRFIAAFAEWLTGVEFAYRIGGLVLLSGLVTLGMGLIQRSWTGQDATLQEETVVAFSGVESPEPAPPPPTQAQCVPRCPSGPS